MKDPISKDKRDLKNRGRRTRTITLDVPIDHPSTPIGVVAAAGFGAGFTAFQSLATQLEQEAVKQGLNVVYNAQTLGKVSGWGGTAGNAWNLAGGDAGKITASVMNNADFANAQMRGLLVDTARQGSPPTSAYNFTYSDPSRFGILKNVLRGLGQASNSLTAFSLIPNVVFDNFRGIMNDWLPPQFRSGGSGPVSNKG